MTLATEWGWQPWSANGKRIAFTLNKTPGNFTPDYGDPWFVARSDASYMRPFAETTARASGKQPYFDWNPSEPDVQYPLGKNYNGRVGLDNNMFYKVTVTDTGGSYVEWVDVIADDVTTSPYHNIKHAISADGLYLFMGGSSLSSAAEPFYVIQLLPSGSRGVTLTYNEPALNPYWGATSSGSWHDEHFTGSSAEGYWIEYYWASPNACHWRMRPWGSDSGAPDYTHDTTDPYDWWEGTAAQTEIQCLGNATAPYPWVQPIAYWQHPSGDVWGRFTPYCAWRDTPGVGRNNPTVTDTDLFTSCAIDGCSDTAWDDTTIGCGYATWFVWSDYICATMNDTGAYDANRHVGIMKYNDGTDNHMIFDTHSSDTGDFLHHGLSPDGTKTAVRSNWLQPTSTNSDLFISVNFYPYPPEITSCTAAGGTVTTRFDWRLDQANPRGYLSALGWPDDDSDDPPPPRETEKFRLWRSPNGSDWTPQSTGDADIFTRYDFTDGTWDGNSYWEITDTPGDGTWYYTVTAIEWSGLESRALGNIFSITVSGGTGTGSQSTAYPSSHPGDLDNIAVSDIYTTAPSGPLSVSSVHKQSPATADGQYTITWTRPASYTMIRYYNIYAEDGSSPDATQQNRIASIPASVAPGGSYSWVDWLGNTGGTTQYVVTSVDYQGNESSVGETPVSGGTTVFDPSGTGDATIDSGGTGSMTF
jgi:hypothetical protein